MCVSVIYILVVTRHAVSGKEEWTIPKTSVTAAKESRADPALNPSGFRTEG